MKSTPTRIIFISFLLVLFIPNLTSAELKTFVKEYTYQASDEDSKNSSRTIALREVKRLLLEELGTYLESVTEVQNFKLTKDQITTLTAGIVQTELIEEKWNTENLKYWIKAKIKADSGEIIKSIDSLRQDRQKTKELEEIRKRSDELLKDNERLRKKLATATGEKGNNELTAYNKTIKDLNAVEWYEKGYSSGISGNPAEAVAAFSKAIELNPQYVNAYVNRGVAYAKLGNNNQAITDYSKAIELNPQEVNAYNNRGAIYASLGNNNQAIADFNKAIELNPQFAGAYYIRGVCYSILDGNQAIADFNKAIELNPQYAKAYYMRGFTYSSLGNDNQAITDYNKAIELNPQYADAYNNRGSAYFRLANYDQAIADKRIAARLGSKEAQNYFRKKGWAW